MPFFYRNRKKTTLEFIWKQKRLQITKATWNKNKSRDIIFPNVKTYYKTAAVIKTVRCSNKNWHIDQCNRIDSPEINAHIYSQLILKKKYQEYKIGK